MVRAVSLSLQSRFFIMTTIGVLIFAACVFAVVGWMETRQIESKLQRFSSNEMDSLYALSRAAMSQRKRDPAGVAISVFNRWFDERNAHYPGKLWSAWGPKTISYMAKEDPGQAPKLPRDEIDEEAMRTGQPIGRFVGHIYRYSIPIVLGVTEGTGDHICTACHGKLIGDVDGDVIAVFSSSLDATADFADLRSLLEVMAAVALLVAAALALAMWLIFGGVVSRPLNRMTRAMLALADGNSDVAIPLPKRSDEIGTMTLALRVFKENAKNLRIAATALESREGLVIADADGVIVRVNQAFCDITGYTSEEAVGFKTNLLKSGAQDAAFYTAMWESLDRSGAWQGEIWNRRKNGEVYPEWLSVAAVKGPSGAITHYVGTFSDITQKKEAEAQIKELAFYDILTGLPNRRLLMERLHRAVASSTRNRRTGALIFIDLDHFKTLNDTLGHDKGDLLLQEVARRLTICVRKADTAARLGGDEFVVVLQDLNENAVDAAGQAEIVCEKIRAALGEPYLLAGYEHCSTPSIGVTIFGDQGASVEELLRQADIAMYQAKEAGRDTVRFFNADLEAAVKLRASIEADLRHGLKHDEFVLHFQPQVEDGRLIGAEALIRWRHPRRGLVLPGEFISLAEETGLIVPLGRWVLEAGCRQIAAWSKNSDMDQVTLAVNVSARQFSQIDFVDNILDVLDRTGANPHRLKLELTESMLADDIEDIITKMIILQSHGVRFSLDDFGTGFSSLSYLKRLPFSQLKIDRSFVEGVSTDPNDSAIARAIVALGESLGMEVIAEGVETEAQRAFLSLHGCNIHQGFLFSRPVPVEEFERFMR